MLRIEVFTQLIISTFFYRAYKIKFPKPKLFFNNLFKRIVPNKKVFLINWEII